MELPRTPGIEQEDPDDQQDADKNDGIADPDLRLEVFRTAPQVTGNGGGA